VDLLQSELFRLAAFCFLHLWINFALQSCSYKSISLWFVDVFEIFFLFTLNAAVTRTRIDAYS